MYNLNIMKKIKLLPISAGIALSCALPISIIGPTLTNSYKAETKDGKQKESNDFKPHVEGTVGLMAFDAADESEYKRAFYSTSIKTVKWVDPENPSTEMSIDEVTCPFVANSQFAFSSLESFVFPTSTTKIGDNAFLECNSLISVDLTRIQDRLLFIDSSMFYLGKSSFKNVKNCDFKVTNYSVDYIPHLINRLLAAGADTSCTLKNEVDGTTTTYKFSEYTKSIPLDLMTFEENEGGGFILTGFKPKAYDKDAYGNWYFNKLVIPGFVSILQDGCFNNLKYNIESVEFEAPYESTPPIQTIPDYAFNGFAQLRSVNFSKTAISTIGEYAFDNCIKLENVYLHNSETTQVDIKQNAFESAGISSTGLTVSGPTAESPARIANIFNSAFYKANILNFNFSDVSSIQENAFKQSSLTQVTFPNTIAEIGSSCFESCHSLESISFTDGGTENVFIGDNAFFDCPLITSFKPCKNIASLGNNALANCTALTVFDLSSFTLEELGTMQSIGIGSGCFNNVHTIGQIKFKDNIEQEEGGITAIEEITLKLKNEGSLPQRWIYIPTALKNCAYVLFDQNTVVNFTSNSDESVAFPDLQISLDYGATWHSVKKKAKEEGEIQTDIDLPLSETDTSVMFIKGDNASGWNKKDEDGNYTQYGSIQFKSTETATTENTIEICGKLSSLLYNAGTGSNYSAPDYCFEGLFGSSDAIVGVSEDLVSNITTIGKYCYGGMFKGCTNLLNAPKLPIATTSSSSALPEGCYMNMFQGCKSLVACPELNSIKLGKKCYEFMFAGCESLLYMPSLPAKDLTDCDECYKNMFNGCIGLGEIGSLPATKLAKSCYESMFQGCTNISIPSTYTLTVTGVVPESAYSRMFFKCENLTTIPLFDTSSATDFKQGAFYGMFESCINLTEVTLTISLPTTITTPEKGQDECFKAMFRACTKLSQVTVTEWTSWPTYTVDEEIYPLTTSWLESCATPTKEEPCKFIATKQWTKEEKAKVRTSNDWIPEGWDVEIPTPEVK